MANLPTPSGPTCGSCVIGRSGRGFINVEGSGRNGVMILDEASSYQEARAGLPLRPNSPSGSMFNRLLKRFVKQPREEFSIVNTIFCKPPHNDLSKASYKESAIESCRPNVDQAIAHFKPKAIVALGNIPTERLIGKTGVLDKRAPLQSYAFWSDEYNCWVVPTVHPNFIQRGKHNLQAVAANAIIKALRIAQEGYSFEEFTCTYEPTLTEFETWIGDFENELIRNPDTVLGFDIETNYKQGKDESETDPDDDPDYDIMQISFSYQDGVGIALSWDPARANLVKKLFKIAGQTCVWNRVYDVPRLMHHGVEFGGPIRDTMIAWHAMQSDLPKGLGFATPLIPGNHRVPFWKGAVEENGGWWYSCMDSIILHRNDNRIIGNLKRDNIYEFFHEFVEEVRPVLDDMENAGVLVDPEAQAQFIVDTETELADLEDAMQPVVPIHLRNYNPPQGYKKDPPKEDLAVGEWTRITIKNQEWTQCPICGLKNPTKPHFKEFRAKAHLHKNTMCSGHVPETIRGDEQRWAKVLPFKPSTQQLLRYALSHGYSVKKNYKTGNYTMDDESVEKLLSEHPTDPLFKLIRPYRAVQKEFGLYGPDGIEIGKDGRVHTHFSDNPSTFRFASHRPNMQNIPRSSLVRGFFIAGPGCLLGARDYTGIEAVLVGYLAGDKDYTRLAKMGVHDYFNAHMAYEEGVLAAADLPNLDWPDDQLAAYLGELKVRLKDSRPIAKKCVHLSNYLGTPLRMYQDGAGMFESVAAAQRIQDLYFQVFPKIAQWQTHTLEQADRQGYLRSPFGLPHRYYMVYTWEKDKETGEWVKKFGPDAKRGAAFNPQHCGAAVMRRSIRDFRNSPVRQYLRLTIHDELMWECPSDKMEEVDAQVKEVMERPNKHLPLDPSWGMGTHLSFGTEGKYGYRWKEMK